MSPMSPPHNPTRYAIAASKGFSYYLPRSAQLHLRALLKQLPSPARSIHNEHYRDVMCGKACAAASAAAMADFVRVFPRCARLHNKFAREMNREIEGNVHEGFEPVLFPVVVVDGEEGEEEGVVEVRVSEGGKRGRDTGAGDGAGAGASTKKVKTGEHPASAESSYLATPAPSSPSGSEQAVMLPPRSSPDNAEQADGTSPSMPSSSGQRLGGQARSSSPLSNAPSGKAEAVPLKSPTQIRDARGFPDPAAIDRQIVTMLTTTANNHPLPPMPLTPTPPLLTDPHTTAPSDPDPDPDSNTPPPPPPDTTQRLEDPAATDDAATSDHALLTDISWEAGLEAIEAFDWSNSNEGSRYEAVGPSGGLSEGGLWDDAGA